MVRKTNGGRKKVRLIKERGPYCARCHDFYEDSDSFSLDHIIPCFMGLKRSYYSKDTNLQVLCYPCQHIKAVLEQWYRDKFGINKGSYMLLMDGQSTPLEAALTEQQIAFINKREKNATMDVSTNYPCGCIYHLDYLGTHVLGADLCDEHNCEIDERKRMIKYAVDLVDTDFHSLNTGLSKEVEP